MKIQTLNHEKMCKRIFKFFGELTRFFPYRKFLFFTRSILISDTVAIFENLFFLIHESKIAAK